MEYDIAILGCGVAGATAAYALRQSQKSVALIDVGMPPLKRRRQMEGWLGLLPSSDGKLFLNDIDHCFFNKDVAFGQVQDLLSHAGSFKINESEKINNNFIKTAQSNDFSIEYYNWMQLYPKDIHQLSRYMNSQIENLDNYCQYFEVEISDVFHDNDIYTIDFGEDGQITAKKIIVALGRSGWRTAHHIFKKFNLIKDNTKAKVGVKIETKSDNLKEFKNSILKLKSDHHRITLGPFLSNGTVIPEDHIEMAQASFRSNEKRWESTYTTFDLIQEFDTPDAFTMVDRLSKLTWLLGNDRIIKESTTYITNGKSKLFQLEEYQFLRSSFQTISNLFPEILERSYYYAPLIVPEAAEIELDSNLQSNMPGLYCIGESARIPGLLGAMISGMKMGDLQ